MPLSTRSVGESTRAFTEQVDARWSMAYSAALGDDNPCYMDTHGAEVRAHPLFPVCLEWPVILASRELPGADAVTREEAARGVHASHDLHILKPIRPGQTLRTQATVIGLKPIAPGAAQTTRLETVDTATGEVVARTYQLGISRGVAVEGEPLEVEQSPAVPVAPTQLDWQSGTISVAAGAAHTYTECARIWNPIHTDRAVALAAGLPDIILHGTATMALAVSWIVDHVLGGNPDGVRRIGGRFSAMVLMPSTLTIRAARHGEHVFYEVLNADGDPAISHGFVGVA